MSGSSTAFSSDGAEVISRKIDPIKPAMEADLQHQRDLRHYYEIERCSEFIKTHNFQKVAWNGLYHFYFIHTSLSLPLLLQIALQFPDFLLPDAAKVSAKLQREFAEKQFFILGDTSYGRYTAAWWGIESVCTCIWGLCDLFSFQMQLLYRWGGSWTLSGGLHHPLWPLVPDSVSACRR